MDTSIHFFSLADEKNSHLIYRGKILWSGYSFRITIIAENVAYDAHVTAEDLAKQCHSLKLSIEEYTEECKIALTDGLSENGFSVTIIDDHLYIKKQLNVDGPSLMKVKFLKVPLQQVNFFEAVSHILDSVFRENFNLLIEKKKLMNENKLLEEDNREAGNCLKKMTQEKIKFEEILYTKFCYLLNSKKRYYQTLLKEPIDDSNSSLFRCRDTKESAKNSYIMPETDSLEKLYDTDTDTDENESSNDTPTTASCKPVEIETNLRKEETSNLLFSTNLCDPIKMEVVDEPESREDSSELKSAESSTSGILNNFNYSISDDSNSSCCSKSLSSPVSTKIENTSEVILENETVEPVGGLKSSSRIADMLNTMKFLDPTVPF